MEGLSKLCLSIYLRPRISKHAWANSIAASWSRSKLKTKNPKPMGDHSHKQWYAPTVTLSYFHPFIHQLKPPVFTKNCLPKSFFFSTLSKILESFHSKTPNRLEFEKESYASIFMSFVTEGPLFLALHAHI